MMKLSEIRNAYEELSAKLSEINRQLCFAGFAIIWIFNKSKGGVSVPEDLYLPAFLLCCSIFSTSYNIPYLHWFGIFIIVTRKKKVKMMTR